MLIRGIKTQIFLHTDLDKSITNVSVNSRDQFYHSSMNYRRNQDFFISFIIIITTYSQIIQHGKTLYYQLK